MLLGIKRFGNNAKVLYFLYFCIFLISNIFVFLLMSGQRLANYFGIPFGFPGPWRGRNSHFRHLWPFPKRLVPSCSVALRTCPIACALHGLQVASRSDFGLDFGPGKLHFWMQFLILQRCLYSFVFLHLFQRFWTWEYRFR